MAALLLASTLAFSACDADERTEPSGSPTSSTSPTEFGSDVVLTSAYDLMDWAGTVGFPSCKRPSPALGPGSVARDAIACDFYGVNERTFRIYDSADAQREEVVTYREVAGAELAPEYEPSSAMTGNVGDVYWIILGQLDLLNDVAPQLRGVVHNYSQLDPEN